MWGVAYAAQAALEWLKLTSAPDDANGGTAAKRPYGMIDLISDQGAPSSGKAAGEGSGGNRDEDSGEVSDGKERKHASRAQRRRRRQLQPT